MHCHPWKGERLANLKSVRFEFIVYTNDTPAQSPWLWQECISAEFSLFLGRPLLAFMKVNGNTAGLQSTFIPTMTCQPLGGQQREWTCSWWSTISQLLNTRWFSSRYLPGRPMIDWYKDTSRPLRLPYLAVHKAAQHIRFNPPIEWYINTGSEWKQQDALRNLFRF